MSVKRVRVSLAEYRTKLAEINRSSQLSKRKNKVERVRRQLDTALKRSAVGHKSNSKRVNEKKARALQRMRLTSGEKRIASEILKLLRQNSLIKYEDLFARVSSVLRKVNLELPIRNGYKKNTFQTNVGTGTIRRVYSVLVSRRVISDRIYSKKLRSGKRI